ncbi:MAG: DUF2271 domain-containing protein [Salinivirgaceae bacterium]|nr:DUF2271 domain-containing protein [Salinivirgaceae bacterium]
MKRVILNILFSLLFVLVVNGQTTGELTVLVTTSSTGGSYAPKNIVAIWIEDDAGNFVKTLLAYAETRKTHLNTWQAATTASGSEFNIVDAVTGATKTSHGTRNCTWDGSDINGSLVTDGTYYVWMELSDKNSTGNYSSFPFTKGNSSESLSPSNEPSFSSIEILWSPVVSNKMNHFNSEIFISPNPGNGVFEVHGDDILDIEIRTITGKLVFKTKNKRVDISDFENGIYLFSISNGAYKDTRKVIKR